MSLADLVITSAKRTPQALAIKGPDGQLTYNELDTLANRCACVLARLGVNRGDRVGIWCEKSTRVVVAMQGVLRLGAIYVPLDTLSPASRIHTILHDCQIQALVTTSRQMGRMNREYSFEDIALLYLDETALEVCWRDVLIAPGKSIQQQGSTDHEIVYILYTSGSTGKPKGVCISNRNALAFIVWAAEAIQASSQDRFSNHAPFHFDLSVFDLYVAFLVGASAFLIPDGTSYIPEQLVTYIQREEITIWYSVPSALVLMMEQGGLLSLATCSLRAILYAGEPFPVKHLHRLYKHWPKIRFFNLYGPTETNVCTFYEIMELSESRTKSVPIGRACSGDTVWAQKDDGSIACVGEEGELMVTGPTVMVGYWGQPEYGHKPYATGDIVRLLEDGNYEYVGRRDQMVKVRGYRVEPGDIETALEEHPSVLEAAVVINGAGMEARLVAFIVCTRHGVLSLLEIKKHCAQRLPRYMIVDAVHFLPALPRTRNGKIDRLMLRSYGEGNSVTSSY